tara:strand:+ start:15425 stop:17902 length:2478 start_codon:yes stop_codon:yes gene_type:complete
MTETRWKKSRVNKSNEIKQNNIDHGTVSYDEPMPIPTFNVLVNTPSPSSSSSEETSSLNVNPSLSTQQQSILSKAIQKIKSVLNPFMKLQPEDDKIIEGLSKFQLFSDDNYYKSCKKILKKLKLDWVLTAISEAIKYALCPLSKTDELIDKGVERFVRLFVQLRNCMKDDAKAEDGELDLSPVAEARLLWNEGDAPLQYTGEDDDDVEEEGIIIEGYEDEKGHDEKGEDEENKDKKDKKEPSSLESNIYTLSDQHTWINTHELIAKLGSHYIYKLNQTENQLGRYLTESELYEFHNTYNNMLEKQDVINSIKGMPISQQWEWLSNKRYSSMSSERRNRRRNPNEPERVLSLCEEKQRAAIQELKQNAKHVKRQIYNIVMIPVVIYIVYNMYYVFLFMEPSANNASDESVEENEEEGQEKEEKSFDYVRFVNYDKMFCGSTNFITEYLFKPTQLLIAALDVLKGSDFKISYYDHGLGEYKTKVLWVNQSKKSSLREINEQYPQILFFVLFVVVFVGWRYNPTFIPDTIKKLYKGQHPLTLNILFMIITGGFFAFSLSTRFNPSKEEEAKEEEAMSEAANKMAEAIENSEGGIGKIFKIIGQIVYWIFKALFAFNMISLSVSIFIIYCLSYLLLGIYIYASKPFDRISRINQFLYSKMFKLSHSESEFENTLMDGLNSISRTIFTHMFEVITIIMLLIGMDGYIKKINNADLNTFLMLLSSLFIFVLCCMMGLKQMNFMSTLKPLMKLLKIPTIEAQLLEEGKTQIGEIQRKVECIRTLDEFMKIVTKETDPDEMDTDACIQENKEAAKKPKPKEGEENKSFFPKLF